MENVVLPLTGLGKTVSDSVCLNKTEPGFQALESQWNLGVIGAYYLNPPADIDQAQISAASAYAAESAIPDVCAHILYLKKKLESAELDMEDQTVLGWVGVLAMLALDDGEMAIDVLDLNCNAGECMKKTYQEALKKYNMLDKKNYLYILRRGTTYIAALDPPGGGLGCLCYPFSTIDDDAQSMDNVAWFEAGHRDGDKSLPHRWLDVTGEKPDSSEMMLQTTQRGRVVEMLNCIRTYQIARFTAGDPIKALMLRFNPVLLNPDNPTQPPYGSLVLDSGMVMNMNAAYNVTDPDSPYFPAANNIRCAWYGVLACIGLSQLHGYRISLGWARNNTAAMDCVYKRCIDMDSCILLNVNDVPVGILDPEWLVIPLHYNYSGAYDGIGWHNCSYDPDYWESIVTTNQISLTDKAKLAGWFQYLADNIPDSAWASGVLLQRIIPQLGEMIQQGTNCTYSNVPAFSGNQRAMGGVTLGSLASITQWLGYVPDYAVPMPTDDEIFTPCLGLALADINSNENRLGIPSGGVHTSVTLTYTDVDRKEEHFQALLPLTASFTREYLTPDANGNQKLGLESVDLVYENAAGSPYDRRIIVYAAFKNGDDTVERARAYPVGSFIFEAEQVPGYVVYFPDFPYVSMWPYINSTAWKKYYTTVSPTILSSHVSQNYFGAPEYWVPVNIDSFDEIHTKQDNVSWQLTEWNAFPEYIHFGFRNNMNSMVEVGSIYIKKPEQHAPTVDKVCAAVIDFGTSNTIVSMVSEGNVVSSDVFSGEWTMPLVQSDDQNFINDVRNFHKFSWLPYDSGSTDVNIRNFWPNGNDKKRIKRKRRVPTAVHVYAGATQNDHQVPRHGTELMTDPDVMHYFMQKGKAAGKMSLSAFGVYSYIKQDTKDSDTTNGSIFIQSVLLQCALAALKSDMMIKPIVSYPDEKMWRNPLYDFWRDAFDNTQRLCSSILVPAAETDLPRARELWGSKCYAEEHIGSGYVSKTAGYCVIDIGGGTSDISVMKQEGRDTPIKGSISVRYAGRQIVSESLFAAHRKTQGAILNAIFRNTENQGALNAYKDDLNVRFGDLEKTDLKIKKNAEDAQDLIPALVDMAVDAIDRRGTGPQTKALRALVSFKIGNIVYILANFIKELNLVNKEQLAEELKQYDDEPLNADGTLKNIRYLGKFTVLFAGGGAGAREFCNPGELDRYLSDIMSTVIAERDYRFFSAKSSQRKTEVVDGITEYLANVDNVVNLTVWDLDNTAEKSIAKKSTQSTSDDDDAHTARKTKLRAMARQSYDFYVENIVRDSDILDLGNQSHMYAMLTLNDPGNHELFVDYIDNILDTIIINEVDSHTSDNMIAHIAAIKVIDKILFVDNFR